MCTRKALKAVRSITIQGRGLRLQVSQRQRIPFRLMVSIFILLRVLRYLWLESQRYI